MIEPSGFREVARSATVTYPVPFAFALLLTFAVLVFGGALISDGLLRWVLAGLGVSSFAVAVGVLVGCVVWKPELLRSEQQEMRHRVMDFVTDSDLGPDIVEVTRVLLQDGGVKKAVAKRSSRASQKGEPDGGN